MPTECGHKSRIRSKACRCKVSWVSVAYCFELGSAITVEEFCKWVVVLFVERAENTSKVTKFRVSGKPRHLAAAEGVEGFGEFFFAVFEVERCGDPVLDRQNQILIEKAAYLFVSYVVQGWISVRKHG